jgi:cytochrome oxidase assembly protein ShyY1
VSYLLGAYGFALVALAGYVVYLVRSARELQRRSEAGE